MNIKYNDSMIVAKQVLNSINKHIPKYLIKQCTIEAYSNGREQGYCILYYSKSTDNSYKICFSQNRNSDDIVIYTGKNFNFNMTGNIPSQIIYKSAIYFGYDEINWASRYIIRYLKKMNK